MSYSISSLKLVQARLKQNIDVNEHELDLCLKKADQLRGTITDLDEQLEDVFSAIAALTEIAGRKETK